MPADQPTPPPFQVDSAAGAEKRPFGAVPIRFSLRTLMRVMTALAVLLGLGAVLPTAVSQIALGAIWIVASGWLITGIVFAKGDARAFCIGAAVVLTSMWTGLGGRYISGFRSLFQEVLYPWGLGGVLTSGDWLIHIVLAATAVGNGYLCIRARRYFERESS